MLDLRELRRLENIHIPLWLIKAICWMMEWRIVGVTMIIPTVTVALIIARKTWGSNEFLINLAICFWIFANAFWMCCEFFNFLHLKNVASIPFVLGIVFTALYYIRIFNLKSN